MESTTFGALMKEAENNGTSFDMLEAGSYVAKIVESEYRSSNGGKPQIKTRWEVVSGPKAGFKGLWNYFTLTTDSSTAMSIFYRNMSALGLDREFMGGLAEMDPATAMKHIASALLNRTATIAVTVDQEWQNNKIKTIKPAPQGEMPSSGSPFPPAAAAPAQSAEPAGDVPF